jgi:hypothetical protein
MAEFDHVGLHCASCLQRAFAPTRCACGRAFCASCAPPRAHACPAPPRPPSELGDAAAAAAAAPAAAAAAGSRHRDAPCVAPGCGLIAATVLRCARCGQGTCVPHRQPGDHACAHAGSGAGGGQAAAIGGGAPSAAARLASSSPAAASAAAHATAAPPPRPRGPLSAKDAALAARVALMRLKSRVPPDEVRRVPEPGRLFLEARSGRAPAASVSVCVDASGGSTVGSLLDALARRLGVANANDRTSDDAARLHMYAAPPLWAPPEAPEPLTSPPLALLAPYSTPLGALVRDGALCSGSTVLLVAGLLPVLLRPDR